MTKTEEIKARLDAATPEDTAYLIGQVDYLVGEVERCRDE